MSDVDQAAIVTPSLPAVKQSGAQPWHVARNVPLRVSVTVPVRGFRLRNLLALRCGSQVLSTTSAAEDVPVHVGGTLLGWAELDNLDGQMAIRLMRLA